MMTRIRNNIFWIISALLGIVYLISLVSYFGLTSDIESAITKINRNKEKIDQEIGELEKDSFPGEKDIKAWQDRKHEIIEELNSTSKYYVDKNNILLNFRIGSSKDFPKNDTTYQHFLDELTKADYEVRKDVDRLIPDVDSVKKFYEKYNSKDYKIVSDKFGQDESKNFAVFNWEDNLSKPNNEDEKKRLLSTLIKRYWIRNKIACSLSGLVNVLVRLDFSTKSSPESSKLVPNEFFSKDEYGINNQHEITYKDGIYTTITFGLKVIIPPKNVGVLISRLLDVTSDKIGDRSNVKLLLEINKFNMVPFASNDPDNTKRVSVEYIQDEDSSNTDANKRKAIQDKENEFQHPVVLTLVGRVFDFDPEKLKKAINEKEKDTEGSVNETNPENLDSKDNSQPGSEGHE